jgi:TM2 domain-containing membrane protein YozV
VGIPAVVKVGYSKLDPKMQRAFDRDLRRRRKSLLLAFLAWFFLGWHYLYLGKIGLQFAFWFTFGGFLLWWLLDLLRLPGLVGRTNDDAARELMAQYLLLISMSQGKNLR